MKKNASSILRKTVRKQLFHFKIAQASYIKNVSVFVAERLTLRAVTERLIVE